MAVPQLGGIGRATHVGVWVAGLCLCASLVGCSEGDPSPFAEAGSDGSVDAGGTGSLDGGELFDAGRDGGAEQKARSQQLINHALWQRVEESDDPFDDFDGPLPDCPDTAFGSETLGGKLTFYVNSGPCGYLTASQPSRAEVKQGDVVTIRYRHFPLTGPEDGGMAAQAHLAFMLGDTLMTERTIQIPAGEEAYADTWTATQGFPPNTPVYLHAHNHGDNEYAVISIAVTPQP